MGSGHGAMMGKGVGVQGVQQPIRTSICAESSPNPSKFPNPLSGDAIRPNLVTSPIFLCEQFETLMQRPHQSDHDPENADDSSTREADDAARLQKKFSQWSLIVAAISLSVAFAAVWQSIEANRATETARTAAETARKRACGHLS